MTPELFQDVTATGERSIGRQLGEAAARARLKAHRDTFITEGDFKWIKRHGFDVVRLPVGYWLFEEASGYISGGNYVDKAFEWAQKHGLKVILDFHGLQGSQNGHDHSGEVGKVRAYWWFNRRRALHTMKYLAQTYGHEPSLVAIELINEPKLPWFMWFLLRYYDQAIAIVTRYARDDVKCIVSDAFQPLRLAKALSRRGYGDRLVLDVHLYQVFSAADTRLSFDEHVDKVEREWAELLNELYEYVPHVLVGEWSAALPAEAYTDMPGGEVENVRRYFSAQQKVFDEHAWAHCYWSYKAPGAGSWDYQTTRFWK